ncbi:hypothetical protein OSB04_un000911 [Centaurea solstitialis]|uniref:Uncharacterized protein n=1 Tax=Centaurea solstitialis TaxID=347529 RepID=A0AA38SBP4_9ASTR|nr:hypothetical protein OSB04_un000911 [Centaurea solstitialis]
MVQFLGHFVNREGIRVVSVRVEAIAKWEVPKTSTKIRSFIGLARYHRWYIQDFSGFAVPLERLLRKNVKLLVFSHSQIAKFVMSGKLRDHPRDLRSREGGHVTFCFDF